jgi:hypothetical protein
VRNGIGKELGVLICAIAAAGCAVTAGPPSENGGLVRQRNEGYSLIYKLMGDESKVGQIFILKDADKSIVDLVKEIGVVCQTAKEQMDQFPKTDNRIEYDETDLPNVEQKSRDLEASEQTKALLFSSGQAFELRLLHTQAQAMDYGKQLAKALAAQESDPARKSFLENLSKRCGELHYKIMTHLAVQS